MFKGRAELVDEQGVVVATFSGTCHDYGRTVRKQLFSLWTQSAFISTLGCQRHPSTMKTFANHANPGDEQVGSITR